MRNVFILLLVGLILTSSAGCYANRRFATSELSYLSGYDVHNERRETHVSGGATSTIVKTGARSTSVTTVAVPSVTEVVVTDRPYRVVDNTGEPRDFNSKVPLYLHTSRGRVGGNFHRVVVTELEFIGEVRGEGTLRVPLRDIRYGELRTYDGTKSWVALLALSVLGGVVVAAAAD